MNFRETLQIGSAVAALIPLTVEFVKSIELAMPNTPGAAKLEAVRTGLSAIYSAGQQAVVAFEQIWPILSALITAFVSAFNVSGLFKKSAA
jgi:hypothetical protein